MLENIEYCTIDKIVIYTNTYWKQVKMTNIYDRDYPIEMLLPMRPL